MGIFLFVILLVIAIYVIRKKQYEKTEYYQQTRNPYMSIRFNKGRLGEFYTYKYLKSLSGYKRYLFNLYLPKDNGETTELDVVLLHESGIYVFESKNYSGWIFGTESQQYWTQTLPAGQGQLQKNQFYNPIMQNKGHLKWLQTFLADKTLPFYSYIVFSDRCTLKNITLTSGKHSVVNWYNLLSTVQQNAAKAGIQLSSDKIDELFEKLYPLTQIDEAEKIIHIRNIQQKKQDSFSKNLSAAAATPNGDRALCPHCGGQLVMRIASKGQHQGKRFWGCSNYPTCKYIENLPDKEL
ncbi:MAG: NERD domain-containing protein [Lachnospiraceae bacterium]|nr:NERD domain-containing protein [Lachnospiraceae bacterium]